MLSLLSLNSAGCGHGDVCAAGGWVSVSWLSLSIKTRNQASFCGGKMRCSSYITVLVSVKLARLFYYSIAVGHYVFNMKSKAEPMKRKREVHVTVFKMLLIQLHKHRQFICIYTSSTVSRSTFTIFNIKPG